MNHNDPQIKSITERIDEIKKLFGISEAEMHLITQLAVLVKIGLGLSPELTLKLLKAYTAIFEMIIEQVPESDRYKYEV